MSRTELSWGVRKHCVNTATRYAKMVCTPLLVLWEMAFWTAAILGLMVIGLAANVLSPVLISLVVADALLHFLATMLLAGGLVVLIVFFGGIFIMFLDGRVRGEIAEIHRRRFDRRIDEMWRWAREELPE